MKNKQLERMALGRRAAYLRRCIRAQELLEKHETGYTVRIRIFYDCIQPELRCSYATFNNMLNERNPRRELENIINELRNLQEH